MTIYLALSEKSICKKDLETLTQTKARLNYANSVRNATVRNIKKIVKLGIIIVLKMQKIRPFLKLSFTIKTVISVVNSDFTCFTFWIYARKKTDFSILVGVSEIKDLFHVLIPPSVLV